MALNVIQVRPPGYVHAECLTELAETVRYGGRNLEGTVVIGAHLGGEFPPEAIIYNTEVVRDGAWFTREYLHCLGSHCVWDYSEENVRRLAKRGITARYVPVGYVPELTRIPRAAEDIDVLFTGSLNDRRIKILNDLKAAGLNVVHLFGVYGAERDAYIARAKICLNLHFYVPGVFEIVRCSYYFANEKCVVSQRDGDTWIEQDMVDATASVPYDSIVETCVDLLQNEWLRKIVASGGRKIFEHRDESEILRDAIANA